MWDSSHTHTHHIINQIGASQSPPLKSLTSSLGPILCGNVSEPTRDYRAGSDTICNNPRKSASHICTIPQKDQSQLRLLVVVNKAQIYPVNTRCGTHRISTHITQSIKLGHHTAHINICMVMYSQLKQSNIFLLRHPSTSKGLNNQVTEIHTLVIQPSLQKCNQFSSPHQHTPFFIEQKYTPMNITYNINA